MRTSVRRQRPQATIPYASYVIPQLLLSNRNGASKQQKQKQLQHTQTHSDRNTKERMTFRARCRKFVKQQKQQLEKSTAIK